MNRILLFLFFTMSSFVLSAQLNDDFSDGNLSSNPTWEGDLNNFIINTDGQLQLNAPDAGSSSIYSELEIPDSTLWEMFIELEFPPSGSNRLRIYLQISSNDFSTASGYFLEIGETGSDDAIHFYRLDNGSESLLASGILGGVADEPAFNLKVTRSAIGEWNIFTDYNVGSVFNLEMSVTDLTYQSGDYFFGYSCDYTASRTDKFFFDNIKIAELLPDVTPPNVVVVNPISFTELEVTFDEVLDETSANDVSNYLVDGNIGMPQSAELDLIEPNKVFLTLNNALTNNTNYNLQVENVKDVEGNTMSQQSLPFSFLIPEPIEPGDLVINEILFNPYTGGKDFIEIYNQSDKVVNLSDLSIGNITPLDEKISEIDDDYLILPGEYVAYTEDEDDIMMRYNVEDPSVLLKNDLPSFNDSEGNVSIFVEEMNGRVMIDSFDYNKDFHYALLDNKEGVSLERISFDTPTQIESNWHSAASTVGFATPTSQNSQLRVSQSENSIFSISENIFSPDQDGFQDLLLIDYQVESEGYLATVHIFDAKGRLVKELFQNESLALEGTLKWDGLNDENTKARIGIYVVLAEIFHPEKGSQQFKNTCVLAGNLND